MEKATRLGTLIGGVMVFVAALIVCVELLLRNLFAVSLGGADELSSYLFAVAVAWSLPQVILTNANIRIEALVALVPAPVRLPLLRLGTLLLGLFLAVLAARAVQMAWYSWSIDARAVTPLQTPLALPQSLWAAGLVVAAATGFLQVLRDHALGVELSGARREAQELSRTSGDAREGGSRR